MVASFSFLGSGGSMGIPVVGCRCSVCNSSNLKNRRQRSSALIRHQGQTLLIDVGPDAREQLLTAGIEKIDGLLITHAHNDHIAGIDDLRPLLFHAQTPLLCFMGRTTYEELRQRYGYLLSFFTQKLKIILLDEKVGTFNVGGLRFLYVTYEQMGMEVKGFRTGSVAYLSDIKTFDSSIFAPLEGVQQLIIGANRSHASPMHLSVEEAVAFGDKLLVPKIILTHISHDLDHDELSESLPSHATVAYDGFSFHFVPEHQINVTMDP